MCWCAAKRSGAERERACSFIRAYLPREMVSGGLQV
jgi:hypothetical protein